MMVGRTLERRAAPRGAGRARRDRARGQEPQLRHRWCENVSFTLRRGEILGFAGLMGAGRTEVARAIFGADRAQSGEIVVHRQEASSIRTPKQAVAAGIGYLSEDRKRFGLAVGMDVAVQRRDGEPSRNISSLDFFLSEARNPRDVGRRSSSFSNIRTPSRDPGGAAALGRQPAEDRHRQMAARDCDILIFDEPTRGIDVGAKAEIYKLLRSASPTRARRSS